MQRSLK